MRVTQRSMYNNHIQNLNSGMSAYMELNMQGASQKKVNRPSDDPAAMAQILNMRHKMDENNQFVSNANAAESWLGNADHILSSSVSEAIREIKVLAGQAATGSVTEENRKQIALDLRGLFDTLLSLSNSEFNGKSIFGGHKYDENAFEEVLAVTTKDPDMKDIEFKVTGTAEMTNVVQFIGGGTVGTDAAAVPIDYRWSDDGGETWETGTLTPPNTTIDMNGIQLEIPEANADGVVTVITPYDPENPDSTKTGSLLIRPTAEYKGDDGKMPPETIHFGGPAGMETSGEGLFKEDVTIKFLDPGANLLDPGSTVKYAYSTDNGATWINTQTTVPNPATGDVRLNIPGGFLEVETDAAAGGSIIPAGTQVIVHPNRADLGYEILDDTFVPVTSVGKDFFGGIENGKPIEGLDPDDNLFEVVGNLIAYTETNDQEGIEACLTLLTGAHEEILTEAARVGSLRNRTSLAQDVLSFDKINKQEALSYTEDVDLTTLLTAMASQQMALNTVLQSSSMIMQLNLSKFL